MTTTMMMMNMNQMILKSNSLMVKILGSRKLRSAKFKWKLVINKIYINLIPRMEKMEKMGKMSDLCLYFSFNSCFYDFYVYFVVVMFMGYYYFAYFRLVNLITWKMHFQWRSRIASTFSIFYRKYNRSMNNK